MHRPVQARRARLAAVVAVAAAMLAAGCGPAAEPGLTDPREVVARTIASTAALRTVAIRAEVTVRQANPEMGGKPLDGGALEGQIDLANREFSVSAVTRNGGEVLRAVVVDGAVFSGMPGGRWMRMPVDVTMLGANPIALITGGAGGPGPGPDVGGILAAAALDPQMAMALGGTEECATGRCYRVGVEIPPELVWPLFLRLSGLDRVPDAGMRQPAARDLPRIVIGVVTDTTSLRLVGLEAAGSAGGTTVEVRIQLADHDAPIVIQAPPADLVDDAFAVPPIGPAPIEPRPVGPEPVPPGGVAP